MKKRIAGLFIISCALIIPSFAQADTYTTSLDAVSDTYVRKGAPNTNEGASPFIRIRGAGDNRGLVQFDQSSIVSTLSGKILVSATLELQIEEAKNNWGKTGREVLVHRLVSPWSEGNGKNAELPPSQSDRGDGIGATWNCAKDQNIANQKVDCAAADDWEMRLKPNATFGAPWVQQSTDGLFINKGQEGTVAFDVTADVQAYLSGAQNHGWIVRKSEENRPGYVSFFSREGASGPQLVLTFADPVPVDITPPVIVAHANITVAATSPAGAEVIYDVPLANDNIDGPVAVTCDPSSGYVFEIGTTVVSCTAEDAAGNVANSTFTVTVTPFVAPDTTPPVIEAHGDLFTLTINSAGAVITYTNPLATDDVDGNVATTCSPASGSLFPVGTTTVSCSAEDAAGNTATSTFAVEVSLVLDDGLTPTIASFTPAVASENIPVTVTPTITFSEPMLASSINNSTLSLIDFSLFVFVPVSVTLDASGTLATITPTTPLSPNTIYAIAVTSGVSDLFGNHPPVNLLDGGEDSYFITAP